MIDNMEVIEMFVSECAENIHSVEEFLGAFCPEERVHDAFRAFHTIKGAAVGVGLEAFVVYARRAEAVLSCCRKEKRKPTEKETAEISICCAGLSRMNAQLQSDSTLAEKFVRAEPENNNENLSLDFSDSLRFLKIDSSELDRIISMAAEASVKADMASSNNDFVRLCAALHRGLFALRSVNLKSVENRLTSLIPSLCAMTGKRAALTFEGAALQVDKSVVEKLGAPLMHMIRNSIDHGIEKPEIRKQNGKNEQGLITIVAKEEAPFLSISITDDGAGIDTEKVRIKALERGLVKESEKMSEQKACSLILMAGFSTAESVSDISGRGVGLDVVKKYAEGLNGTLEISTVKGKGTTVTLKLPASLSLVDALILKTEGFECAVAEREVRSVLSSDLNYFKSAGGRLYVRLGAASIPVFDLENHIKGMQENFEAKGYVTVIKSQAGETGIFTKNAPETKNLITSSLGIIDEQKTVFSAAYTGDNAAPCLLIDAGRFTVFANKMKKEAVE